MSDFIDEILKALCITDKRGNVSFVGDYHKLMAVKNKLYSLGENAHRMLEIGIVQDELVKLGLTRIESSCELEDGGEIIIDEFITLEDYSYNDDDYLLVGKICISFDVIACNVSVANVWIDTVSHKEIIAKVRELIGDKS